jgi:hypothetical protein
LAEQGLFLTIATLLWAFDIKPGLDENVSDRTTRSFGLNPLDQSSRLFELTDTKQGVEVKLDTFAYTKSENMRPEPFKARFIPRSKGIAGIIQSEATRARKELCSFDGETRLTMENVP